MPVNLVFDTWEYHGPPAGRYEPPSPEAMADATDPSFLLLSNATWNDFHYRTEFLVYAFVDREWVVLGQVCIGVVNQAPGSSTYEILGRPTSATTLGDTYFSLGRDLSLYQNLLERVGPITALDFLRAIRDVTAVPEARALAAGEAVFQISHLRGNPAVEALDRAAALFGGSTDTRDAFKVWAHVDGANRPHEFEFDFTAGPLRSTMSVLVGLNGTGKTQSMARLAQILSRVFSADPDDGATGTEWGEVEQDFGRVEPRPSIYGVVAVSFSAFDDFVRPNPDQSSRLRYAYCGLPRTSSTDDGMSAGNRLESNIEEEIRLRFQQLDPDQRELALKPLLPTLDDAIDPNRAYNLGELPYDRLSAGQRIVLSITTELVVHVLERTLVLIDEPETHLHPQLLSSLIAWIGELLAERDSFSIVATHSPIVVQQVPAALVHVLRRQGNTPIVGRPSIETFGANLTEIVRDVFEDSLGDRSYRTELAALFEESGSVEAVNALFGGRLGMNALVYLHSLDSRSE